MKEYNPKSPDDFKQVELEDVITPTNNTSTTPNAYVPVYQPSASFKESNEGISLGGPSFSSSPFSVTRSGILRARSASTFNVKETTDFSNSARFSFTGTSGGGALTFMNYGVYLQTGTVVQGIASVRWTMNSYIFNGSPTFSCAVLIDADPGAVGDGSSFFGLGTLSFNASGHIYTGKHIGFKILRRGGVFSLYATQADGTTESSEFISTVLTGQAIDLILKVDGNSSVSYYHRSDGAPVSGETKLSANIPTGNVPSAQFSTSCDSNYYINHNFYVFGASYER